MYIFGNSNYRESLKDSLFMGFPANTHMFGMNPEGEMFTVPINSVEDPAYVTSFDIVGTDDNEVTIRFHTSSRIER